MLYFYFKKPLEHCDRYVESEPGVRDAQCIQFFSTSKDFGRYKPASNKKNISRVIYYIEEISVVVHHYDEYGNFKKEIKYEGEQMAKKYFNGF